MSDMNSSSVTRLAEYENRERRVSRAMAARRRMHERAARALPSRDSAGGRAWVNGRELGGTDPRHAHLGVAFD
ncbi:MAG: hypothetical protein QOD53_1731 [Thermoleophilaceae bacterium]|jgi:hypothetical protein|nr:hypothetical protein [Thermoleophilaceae bacterium]